ncbi:Alpha/beta hydrolase fold protein [Candidatus Nitrospira nitrificans]|uniref:Alpha/beta hydrolase fold protein n=1 Tax=Candidatus Nitrospira nitrificans TaxID=1742973 RepID=A0A0S4LKS1_9BACT|nr:Alpha/beta hydrolase fold protein [Candidatus Nitrospira nitrificans]
MNDSRRTSHQLSTFSFQWVEANHLSVRVATAGSGEKLILCLHGFPESAISWRHQIDPLAQAGYRVWAPDLRGYGGTTRPAGIDSYRIESLMDDVTGLLDAARVQRAILVGHDWGGIIAWYYAMRHATRVEALIIVNAPHPACFEREVRHWRQLHRSWYMGVFQLPWLPEEALSAGHGCMIGEIFRRMAKQMPDDLIQLYQRQACEPGALTAMVNYYRAALRGGGALRQRRLGYPTIHVPTLVIWGVQDQALVSQNLDRLHDVVDQLTVVTVADAGHFVHEDKPEQVTRDLLMWLQYHGRT